MLPNRFNVLMDLQWGSCGKGKFAPYLADQFDVHHASCSHRPNAGHTVQIGGQRWVLKCLPSAVVLRTHDKRRMACYLSAGAAYNWEQLETEIQAHHPSSFITHPRMMEVRPEHRVYEEQTYQVIASTMQGAGAALVEKIERRAKGLSLGTDLWLDAVDSAVRDDGMLHEAAQGWELSIDHGTRYPYVTSRNCGTAAALDEMAVNPRLLGAVYGVFRPFPIRVGNFGEFSSGPAHRPETSWKKVLEEAGAPPEIIEAHVEKYEFTTVTKRRRRVFDISFTALRRAILTNGVSALALNFAQYLDWELAGQKGKLRFDQLPARVREFVQGVNSLSRAKVQFLGTGPEHSEVIELC